MVRRWSSRGFCRLLGVDSGQIHSWPRAQPSSAHPQPTISMVQAPRICLRFGRQSPRLQPGPPDPQHPPGSLALCLRSSTTCSTAVGQPPGVRSHPASMTPPSIGSTVGHHQGCGPGPAVLGVPSVSSLAPPSVAPWSLSSGPLLGVHPPPEAPPKLPPRAERLIAFAIISRYEKIRFLNRRGCSYTVTWHACDVTLCNVWQSYDIQVRRQKALGDECSFIALGVLWWHTHRSVKQCCFKSNTSK